MRRRSSSEHCRDEGSLVEELVKSIDRLYSILEILEGSIARLVKTSTSKGEAFNALMLVEDLYDILSKMRELASRIDHCLQPSPHSA